MNALLLKDTLNRFRLVGPLSQTILKNSLLLTTLDNGKQEKIDTEMIESEKTETENIESAKTEDDTAKMDLDLTERKVVAQRPAESISIENVTPDIEIVSENNNEAVYWWKNYFQDKSWKDFFDKEEKFWLKFDQFLPGQMPSGFTFGLVVRDPRKLLPPKRGCAQIPPKGKLSNRRYPNSYSHAPCTNQWGSEIWMCLDFEQSKIGQFRYGIDFE